MSITMRIAKAVKEGATKEELKLLVRIWKCEYRTEKNLHLTDEEKKERMAKAAANANSPAWY